MRPCSSEPPRPARMRTAPALLRLVAICVCLASAAGARAGDGEDARSIDDYVELSRQPRKELVTKDWIIERARKQKLVGLRERGNPHIRDGLLLKEIQDDPERSRIDRDRAREAAIARIQRGKGSRRGKGASAPPPVEVAREEPAAGPPESGGGVALWSAVGLGLVLVLGAVGLYVARDSAGK